MGCVAVRMENIYIYIFFFFSPKLITFKALRQNCDKRARIFFFVMDC